MKRVHSVVGIFILLEMLLSHSFCNLHCRSASVAATAAVRSIADDEEENVDSASSEDAEKYGINEVDDSSVCVIYFHTLILHAVIIYFQFSVLNARFTIQA